METDTALRALLSVDIAVTPHSENTIAVNDGSFLRMSRVTRTPTPANVAHDLARLHQDERILYVVDRVTSSLARAAEHDGRIVIVSKRGDSVWYKGKRIALGESSQNPVKVRRGPKPYGEFAVARALLAQRAPQKQIELGKNTGLNQASVSNALRALGDRVVRNTTGWSPVDPAELFDYAVADYPGVGGFTVYGWNDTSPVEQADVVARAIPHSLFSGDLAAAHISGWRQSEHAVVYVDAGVDLAALGFALATSKEYTVSVTIPADRTVWTTAAAFGTDTRFADPVLTAYDVRNTGTTGDQNEAADAVRRATLDRLAR